MSDQSDPKLGINSWLEEELYQTYLHDRKYVDESWKSVFEGNGHGPAAVTEAKNGASSNPASTSVAKLTAPAVSIGPADEVVPLRGVSAKIAENMAVSLSVPTATSQRIIQVRVLDENRQLINQHRAIIGKSKISYTHIVGWAILRS